MDVFEAIKGRRSVRDFANKTVDDETIRDLIAVASQAPSAVNRQPWTFTVVRDRKVLDHISQGAKALMLSTLGVGEEAEHFRALLAKPEFHVFYNAPALVVISANAPGPWTVENCALAAENLMLAAHARGMGTCWIGFAQSYLGTADGRATLGIPEAWEPVAPVILGYPSAAPPIVPRHEPVIRWLG